MNVDSYDNDENLYGRELLFSSEITLFYNLYF